MRERGCEREDTIRMCTKKYQIRIWCISWYILKRTPGPATSSESRPVQVWVVRVGGDDGEFRPWHYIRKDVQRADGAHVLNRECECVTPATRAVARASRDTTQCRMTGVTWHSHVRERDTGLHIRPRPLPSEFGKNKIVTAKFSHWPETF